MRKEMVEGKILLKTIENVKNFVNMISKCRGEAVLTDPNGKRSVDAKSIMGIFTLNITQPLDLTIFSEDGEHQEIFNRFAA